ncbi:MAG: fibronectin type III domain-containing protein [Pseudobdellovibrio sp.]
MIQFQNCGKQQAIAESASIASAGSNNSSGSTTNNNSASNNSSTSIPAPPGQLALVASSSKQINLTWSDNSSDESGFKIERAVTGGGPLSGASGPGSFSVVGSVGANVTSYSDTGLIENTLYYYRITSYNSAGNSTYSAVMSIKTQPPPTTPPAAPSNLKATATAASLMTISWTDNSNNESSFYIERSSDNGVTFKVIAIDSTNETSYQDYNLIESTTYIYRVRASNDAGFSTYTANASGTTLAAGNKATFTYVYTNIIQPNCVSCHGAGMADAGVRLDSYNGVLGIVMANNANGSRLVQDVAGGSMPPGTPLSADQLNSIKLWINAGALNN